MTLTRPAPPASLTEIDEPADSSSATIQGSPAISGLRPTGESRQSPTIGYHHLRDLLITDCVLREVEGVRTPAVARQDSESLLVITAFAGTQFLETSHRTEVLRPSDLLVLNSRVSGRAVVPDSVRKRTVRIPLTALAAFDTGKGAPDFLSVAVDQNPLAALTRDFLVGLVRQIVYMSPVEVEGARNALLALTAGMLRASHAPDVGSNDFLALLRNKLEAWIIDHLDSGAIRVSDLAAAHNVAPRTVHRAFAHTGDTVGSIVRRHRMA